MGTTRPSVVTFLAERPDHGLGVPVDDGEQHPSCPVGNTPTLFPLLNSPHVETEAFGELLTVQPKPLAEGDDPAWQLRLAADMARTSPSAVSISRPSSVRSPVIGPLSPLDRGNQARKRPGIRRR